MPDKPRWGTHPFDPNLTPAERRSVGKDTVKQREAQRANLMLAAAATTKVSIAKARKSSADFVEFVLRTPKGTTLELQPFHREWHHLFGTRRRVQIEAAKSHGKTTNLLGFLLWIIGCNPDIRIKLFAQSEEKARERLTTIAGLIETNKLLQLVFPGLRKSTVRGDPWHKSAITVERSIKDPNATLEASGILGSVEGGRADLVLFDDISDHRTAIIYPQHREAIKKKVYAEILPMLEVDGRALSIGTPHHDADIVASLRRNPEWDAHVYPVGIDDDPFLPLWPNRWSRKALMALQKEIGITEYNRAFRCQALAEQTVIIRPEHIAYYDRDMLGDPWGLICVQAYDLAITDKRGSSFFACVTVLYDPENDIAFIADAWQDKLEFAQQARAIVSEAAQWNPDRIVIEETGYQRALREYLLDIARSNLPIQPISPGNKSKELRLTETLPMFETGRIFFNPALDSNLYPEVPRRGDLIRTLLTFTMTKEQDLGDAFAHAIRALRFFRRELGDDPDQWQDGDGLTTRLSFIGR